jgi:hypothetical protein
MMSLSSICHSFSMPQNGWTVADSSRRRKFFAVRPRNAIERTNALALFPRLGTAPPTIQRSRIEQVRHTASRVAMRGVSRLIS